VCPRYLFSSHFAAFARPRSGWSGGLPRCFHLVMGLEVREDVGECFTEEWPWIVALT
jgi:hypothetical protein